MQSFSCSDIFSLNVFSMQIICFCKFHIYSLSDQSYSQQNSSALYEKSVIISKLKDLKDIINYRLSCDVITLWAATAGGTAAARLSGKRHKVSESRNRSSRCTREMLLADICFPPQQPVGKYVWHCGCSSTITAERLCHWVLMGRSRPVSYMTIKNHVCFLDSCVSSALTKTPGNIKTASASLIATKHTDSCHTWWSGIS